MFLSPSYCFHRFHFLLRLIFSIPIDMISESFPPPASELDINIEDRMAGDRTQTGKKNLVDYINPRSLSLFPRLSNIYRHGGEEDLNVDDTENLCIGKNCRVEIVRGSLFPHVTCLAGCPESVCNSKYVGGDSNTPSDAVFIYRDGTIVVIQ